MIEKSIIPGPHVIHVEERRHRRTGASLPATQFLCFRKPATHIHEAYRCPHGERRWCVGDIKPGRSEVEERMHELFGCDCTIN